MTASAVMQSPGEVAASATAALRRARAVQLDQVHAVVASGRWQLHGHRSPHAWLAVSTGEAPGTCSLTLHLAERLQVMPIAAEQFRKGVLAESALRLLADAWRAEIAAEFARDEQMLVGWALRFAHRDFELVLHTWVLHADPDRSAASAEQRFDARRLHLAEMLDGMVNVDGLLDPEGAKIVREAITHLGRRSGPDDPRSAAQRRADALVSMAKQALAEATPEPGRKRWRPKMIATIAYDDLAATTGGGVLDTNSGPVTLPAQAIRRLACDSELNRMVTGPADAIINYGRSTRTVSDAQFDLLTIRDHGCRIPGCPVTAAGCDAHHANHWVEHHGNTDLDELVLLCWYHHHWLHEQHWKLEPLGAGHFQLNDPAGCEHLIRPPLIGGAPT